MVHTSTVEGWPHTEPTLIHSSAHLRPFNPPPPAPSLDPARVHRRLQRGRSVLTLVMYCHDSSVDNGACIFYDRCRHGIIPCVQAVASPIISGRGDSADIWGKPPLGAPVGLGASTLSADA